jgi:hypothetical protein
MEAPGNDAQTTMKVEVKGIDDILFCIQEQDALIAKYERFAEDVLLSCVMPEIPRSVLADDEDGSIADRAHDALQTLLVRYRKITSWIKANKIDIESIVGNNDNVKS